MKLVTHLYTDTPSGVLMASKVCILFPLTPKNVTYSIANVLTYRKARIFIYVMKSALQALAGITNHSRVGLGSGHPQIINLKG